MGTLGWSLTGLGIWVFVSLAIPLAFALVERPGDTEESKWIVGLSWLWPVLAPLLLAGAVVVGPFLLLGAYANLLAKPKVEEEKPLEGKVVE